MSSAETTESNDPEDIISMDHWLNRWWEPNLMDADDWNEWYQDLRTAAFMGANQAECIYCERNVED